MSDWAKNPDVQELLRYNREARQATCEHQPMGPAWDAVCVKCFKRLGYGEALSAYERLDATLT